MHSFSAVPREPPTASGSVLLRYSIFFCQMYVNGLGDNIWQTQLRSTRFSAQDPGGLAERCGPLGPLKAELPAFGTRTRSLKPINGPDVSPGLVRVRAIGGTVNLGDEAFDEVVNLGQKQYTANY